MCMHRQTKKIHTYKRMHRNRSLVRRVLHLKPKRGQFLKMDEKKDTKNTKMRNRKLFRRFLSFKLIKGQFLNMDEEKGIRGNICTPWFFGYKSHDVWRDLHCPDKHRIGGGRFIVATTCLTPDGQREYNDGDPSKYKVFVKLRRRYDESNYLLRNLADYIHLVKEGVVSEMEHNDLFLFIEEQRKKVAYYSKTHEKNVIAFNHNMDVAVLHFKFRCLDDYKCTKKNIA